MSEQIYNNIEDFKRTIFKSNIGTVRFAREIDWRETETVEGIGHEWNAGGWDGGDCWGAEATPYSGDVEPEFTAIDDFVTQFLPEISVMQYISIKRLVKVDQYKDRGFYGNVRYRGVRYIPYEDLFKAYNEIVSV